MIICWVERLKDQVRRPKFGNFWVGPGIGYRGVTSGPTLFLPMARRIRNFVAIGNYDTVNFIIGLMTRTAADCMTHRRMHERAFKLL